MVNMSFGMMTLYTEWVAWYKYSICLSRRSFLLNGCGPQD